MCVLVFNYTTEEGADRCFTAYWKNSTKVNVYLVLFKVL